jgi:APA family basic amino acid/polyamine antiporter
VLRALDTGTIEGIVGSGFLFIGIPATMALVGDIGVYIVMGTIFIAILGALNATILSFSRVYFAVAKDFPKLNVIATLDERRQTPVRALAVTALMALILLPFQISDLISLVAFGGLVFNTLIFISLFKLKKKDDTFVTPLFPYLPMVSIGITVLLLVAIFVQNPLTSLIGVGVIAVAIPVYELIK